MSFTGYLIACGAVATGAFVQGSLGFGLGLVAAPVLALVDRDLVPGPLLFVGVPLACLLAWRERFSLDWKGIRWAIVGRVIGTAVGAWAITRFPERVLVIVFSVSVLAAVTLSISGWKVRVSRRSLVTAGTASGFMGTVTSIGGPPMAIVYQHESGPQLRSSLAGFFLFGASLSLAVLAIGGEFHRAELLDGLALLPAMLLGVGAAARLARVLDRGHSRSAVLGFSALASIVLLVNELW